MNKMFKNICWKVVTNYRIPHDGFSIKSSPKHAVNAQKSEADEMKNPKIKKKNTMPTL